MTGGGSPEVVGGDGDGEQEQVRAQWPLLFFQSAVLTGGLARHDDRVSLHHRHLPGADRCQRRPEPTLHEDLHLDLRHALSVPPLADVDARVVRVDSGPLQRE